MFFGLKTLQEVLIKYYNFSEEVFVKKGITEPVILNKYKFNEAKLKNQIINTEHVLNLKDRTLLFFDVGPVRIFVERNNNAEITYSIEKIN